MTKITKERRKEALLQAYKDKGKGDRHWYLVDVEQEYGISSFTPDEGNVFITILERKESLKFFQEIFVHYNIGADNHAFLCLDKMYGKTCPICALREELKASGEPDDIIKAYNYAKRYLMWVVNAESARTFKEGPKLYDAATTIKNGILDACIDPRSEEIIDPSDPAEGINITFKRIGKKGNQRTEYRGFSKETRDFDIPEDYFDLPDMMDLLIEPDINDIKKVLGLVAGKKRNNDEEEEDEKPRRKFRDDDEKDERPRKLKSRRTEEEDEANEDDDDDEATVQERKVSDIRKRKIIKRKDEDELEEEEDDNELPFNKRRRIEKNEDEEEEDSEDEREKEEVLKRTRNRLRKVK